MRRGETPTIPLVVDFDLTEWECYVILKAEHRKLKLGGDRLVLTKSGDNTSIDFKLTQQETLAFPEGVCEVQVKAYKDGSVVETDIQGIEVGRTLDEDVLHA